MYYFKTKDGSVYGTDRNLPAQKGDKKATEADFNDALKCVTSDGKVDVERQAALENFGPDCVEADLAMQKAAKENNGKK